ncbi:hypothetical protein Asp14428_69250 [Actinoplanes sp. NBRC 14428]|uniref:Uncharacterized protein n=1 Tax=Pseudosporangium ferrugineum TaxID=439699 RepID=A0A2T0RQK1_9ACTN|nr:hypothetical protein [Pseudosporangium ferrugineum]PRY23448.1 hypothetical protein CLV70_115181 [Pseudosporangium ferrugineum]BCJ55450.1 hypothetical protein Asp14428_69250 [Actinoplanes sp. NBRC 14428]
MTLSRNRWILAAGVTGIAVAVAVTGAVAANAAQEPAPRSTASAGEVPVSIPEPPVAPDAIGTVIDTGIAAKQGTWVFAFVPVKDKELPQTDFGLMAGRRQASGAVSADVMVNEVVGPAKAPGFHGIEGAMEVNGEPTPAFGYYVGAAERITAKAGKRTVTAKIAAWSEDSSVKAFWFAPGTGEVTDVRAFDAAGKALPAGHDVVAVG